MKILKKNISKNYENIKWMFLYKNQSIKILHLYFLSYLKKFFKEKQDIFKKSCNKLNQKENVVSQV